MPRLRLGVALLVPPPHDVAVDALRRAAGDPALGRIPAHLTLVPPVNVREDRLDDALDVLRAAAASSRAFPIDLGPPATFLPVNPVLYLPVASGEGAVQRLRDAVFTDPLARSLTWPFVPHVTLADDAPPERIEAAIEGMGSFHLSFSVTAVHLLQEGPDRRWQPIADAELAPPAVIGRGGLEVELIRSGHPDPATAGALGIEPFCITARRDGNPAGLINGYVRGRVAFVDKLLVIDGYRNEGIGSQLVAAAESLASDRRCDEIRTNLAELKPFLDGRGWSELTRRLAPPLR